ncbi:MAG TPA: hypothetical protein VF230_00915 [Acidimicrobiales bacterium]
MSEVLPSRVQDARERDDPAVDISPGDLQLHGGTEEHVAGHEEASKAYESRRAFFGSRRGRCDRYQSRGGTEDGLIERFREVRPGGTEITIDSSKRLLKFGLTCQGLLDGRVNCLAVSDLRRFDHGFTGHKGIG